MDFDKLLPCFIDDNNGGISIVSLQTIMYSSNSYGWLLYLEGIHDTAILIIYLD